MNRAKFIILSVGLLACRSTTTAKYEEVDIEDTIIYDYDGDGYLSDEDCDDQNALVNSNADEICDGVDNNCDGQIDEDVLLTFFLDSDGDGFGNQNTAVQACSSPDGHVPIANDCNDNNNTIFPGATEVCDDVDNDCDGDIDEDSGFDFYLDNDGDGFGDVNNQIQGCNPPEDYVANPDDCNDGDAQISPTSEEICNQVDDNCNGLIDSEDPSLVNAPLWYIDYDNDGYGNPDFPTQDCNQPENHVNNADDCDDLESNSSPGVSEICDEIDNDCDGDIDEQVTTTFYLDSDGDGYGISAASIEACSLPVGYATEQGDCNDNKAETYPGATEICDGNDNDCDGTTDEDLFENWYLDYDGDGFGDDNFSVYACEAPDSIYVNIGGDCNDLDSEFNPQASLGCDGEDHNCDGIIDNDNDGDGFADATCGGDDCDDNDPTIYPVQPDICPMGISCLDILNKGLAAGDGEYYIDVDGYNNGVPPELVYCDMTNYGGGWTMIARDDPTQSGWSTALIINSTAFGLLAEFDYKAEAWNDVLFTDLMFDDGYFYAVYEGVGDGSTAWYNFQANIPLFNCAIPDGYEYPMTAGNLSGGNLCSTNLYIHPTDNDGGGPTYCYPDGIYSDNAYGPTWSAYNNGACPLDDPIGTSFYSRFTALPWSDSDPLHFYVR